MLCYVKLDVETWSWKGRTFQVSRRSSGSRKRGGGRTSTKFLSASEQNRVNVTNVRSGEEDPYHSRRYESPRNNRYNNGSGGRNMNLSVPGDGPTSVHREVFDYTHSDDVYHANENDRDGPVFIDSVTATTREGGKGNGLGVLEDEIPPPRPTTRRGRDEGSGRAAAATTAADNGGDVKERKLKINTKLTSDEEVIATATSDRGAADDEKVR